MRDLAHRYAALVDGRDFPGVAALFTEDGVLATARPPKHLSPVAEHVGPAGVLEAMALLGQVPRTFHEVVGAAYDGDTGLVACVAHHVMERDGVPVDLVWHLRYRDTYRETPDGWRFARREVHVDLVSERPLSAYRG